MGGYAPATPSFSPTELYKLYEGQQLRKLSSHPPTPAIHWSDSMCVARAKMNTLIPQLLSYPPSPPQSLSDVETDAEIRKIVRLLNSTSASKLIASPTGQDGDDDLLDILDPAVNSLPYLFTLLAHANAQGETELRITPGGRLWEKMEIFVSVFDVIQVRYCGRQFRNLLEAVARGAENVPDLAIELIRMAMLRLDPSTSTFTSTHLLLVRLCLLSRAYDLALPILNNDIFHFPFKLSKHERESRYLPLLCAHHETSATFITAASGFSEKLRYQDHLQYFLFGAMIYIAHKDWERALSFLEIVISHPAVLNAASMIQVEAYKKWVLVCLLYYGKPQSLPRHVPQHVLRYYHTLAKPYEIICETFQENDGGKLEAEIAAGPFAKDYNHSLAMLVLDSQHRFALVSLSRAYASIALSNAAKLTSPSTMSLPETESYISQLISSGQLEASLVTKQAPPTGSAEDAFAAEVTLRFHSSRRKVLPTSSSSSTSSSVDDEASMLAELEARRDRIDKLRKHIVDTQRRVELSNEYVQMTRKWRKEESGAESGKGGAISLGGYKGGWGQSTTIDEDMLAEM